MAGKNPGCTDERCHYDFDKHEYVCYCGTYMETEGKVILVNMKGFRALFDCLY